MRRLLVATVSIAAALTVLLAPGAAAQNDVNTNNLRRGVTLGGILEHQRAFQDIALANEREPRSRHTRL